MPYDGETILASVRKTGRLLVVDEGFRYCGFASEIIAFVVENAMGALRQPPRQVTTMHTTVPFSPPMENYVFPNKDRVAEAIRAMLAVQAEGV